MQRLQRKGVNQALIMELKSELETLKKEKREQDWKHKQALEQQQWENEHKFSQAHLKATQARQAADLADCSSIEEKLAEMSVTMAKEKLDRFVSRQQQVAKILGQVDITINNNQFAAAVAAIHDPKSKRQVLSVPSGMGKSRIIAAVVAMKSLFDGLQHFTVVFTTDLLKQADERMLTKLAALLQADLKLVVHDRSKVLDSELREKDFVVLDEADQILLDHHELLSHARILGLTATPFALKRVEEKEYLERE